MREAFLSLASEIKSACISLWKFSFESQKGSMKTQFSCCDKGEALGFVSFDDSRHSGHGTFALARYLMTVVQVCPHFGQNAIYNLTGIWQGLI